MRCSPFKMQLHDGSTVTGFVTMSHRKKRLCKHCQHQEGMTECDWPGRGDVKTSCSLLLCKGCRRAWMSSLRIQPDLAYLKQVDGLDLCPSHFAAARAGRGRGTEALLSILDAQAQRVAGSIALAMRLRQAESPDVLARELASAVRTARSFIASKPGNDQAERIGIMADAMERLALVARGDGDVERIESEALVILDRARARLGLVPLHR